MYVWRVSNVKALNFLRDIIGFLAIKKDQAQMVIDLQESKPIYARWANGQHCCLPKETLEQREAMFQQVKAMKKDYLRPKYWKKNTKEKI